MDLTGPRLFHSLHRSGESDNIIIDVKRVLFVQSKCRTLKRGLTSDNVVNKIK
jgi:hypothetical protein